MVLSPGIPRTHPLFLEAIRRGIEVIDEMELGFRHFQGKAIGITGTNGKTTVALLCEHVLNQSGIRARAVGNIGVPLTSLALEKEEIIVVEVSSYQLEMMSSSVFDSAVILNITPDHLDRYASMEEYGFAKMKIAGCLNKEGDLFIYDQISAPFINAGQDAVMERKFLRFGASSKSTGFQTDKESARSRERVEYILPLSYRHLGIHESINALAAYLLCRRFGVAGDQFVRALETFKKPPHRIEFVRELGGVSYFDDSKGTNIDAVIHAVEALGEKVILIAGGLDKGSGYGLWKTALKKRVKKIIALGEARKRIYEELKEDFDIMVVETLQMAVDCAQKAAEPGDYVLLSPGCASYDMFRDYAHRGEEFQRLVNILIERKKDEP
jgi:UDP-N-acetylmuramoylalanine--D-glutamate ligase